MSTQSIIRWALRLVVVAIMLWASLPKLMGAEMSISLFEKLGVEPWGRYGTGIMELLGAILLLIPATVVIGAMIVIVVMVGAIGAHFIALGFEGQMMMMTMLATANLVISLVIAWLYRRQLSL